jgi:glutamine amidotransferase
MITIIDYGMGNTGSIKNMLKYLGYDSCISRDIEVLKAAAKLILPGVGSFGNAKEKLLELNLVDILKEKVVNYKIPVLGICLGMQLLTDYSEEGDVSGLGLIKAKTMKFSFSDSNIKIPHMGWNYTRKSIQSELTNNLQENSKFYFVHSYFVKVENEGNSILKTNYGGMEFDSAIQKDNIYGVQFHPEKSHKFGMKILENFAKT